MLDRAAGSPHSRHSSCMEQSGSAQGRLERGRHGVPSNAGLARANPEMDSCLRLFLFLLLFILFGLDALQTYQFLLLTQADQRDALGIAAKR